MKWKQFLKPDWRKIVITIVLIFFVFLFIFSYTTVVCVDPSEEGWMENPDPEYWGCHTMLHRYFHFIPDWSIDNIGISFLVSAVISYLLSCLIVWFYDKYKKKRIR